VFVKYDCRELKEFYAPKEGLKANKMYSVIYSIVRRELIRKQKGKKVLAVSQSSLLIAPLSRRARILVSSPQIRYSTFPADRVLIASLMQGTAILGDRCSGCSALISLENAAEITLCTSVCNTVSAQPAIVQLHGD
jgi:hypothetical protein